MEFKECPGVFPGLICSLKNLIGRPWHLCGKSKQRLRFLKNEYLGHHTRQRTLNICNIGKVFKRYVKWIVRKRQVLIINFQSHDQLQKGLQQCVAFYPLLCLCISLSSPFFPRLPSLHFVEGLCLCCCLVTKSCLTLLQLHGLWPARLLCPWDFPGNETGVGCHFLLQEIFLTQG